MSDFRIGYGYDVHALAEGEEFWLGGILVPHEKGAVGHSDADVVLHVICDALLGALGMRDIGHHFPDTDPAYKGIDSKKLLAETYDMCNKGDDNLVVGGGLTKSCRICPCKSSVYKELGFRHTLEEVDEIVCGREVAEQRDAWIL